MLPDCPGGSAPPQRRDGRVRSGSPLGGPPAAHRSCSACRCRSQNRDQGRSASPQTSPRGVLRRNRWGSSRGPSRRPCRPCSHTSRSWAATFPARPCCPCPWCGSKRARGPAQRPPSCTPAGWRSFRQCPTAPDRWRWPPYKGCCRRESESSSGSASGSAPGPAGPCRRPTRRHT